MSIMMVLEADTRLTRDQIISAIKPLAVMHPQKSNEKIEGEFKYSGLLFFCGDAGNENYVVAEGFKKLEWQISTRVTFHYIQNEFEKCSLDLHKFIDNLCDNTLANFVLSFQYEGFYAIRDENGFRLLQNF